MISFRSTDSYHLTGRGHVWVVALDRDCRIVEGRRTFGHLIGQQVRIDGRIRTVIGVESSAKAGTIWKGEPIGLLVRD